MSRYKGLKRTKDRISYTNDKGYFMEFDVNSDYGRSLVAILKERNNPTTPEWKAFRDREFNAEALLGEMGVDNYYLLPSHLANLNLNELKEIPELRHLSDDDLGEIEYAFKSIGYGNEPQKYARKFAGEIYKNEEFMSELKSLADDQVRDEMFEEEMRQLGVAEAMHGKSELAAYLSPNNPSRTSEQKIARNLLFKGYKPTSIPADSVLGANTTMQPRETGIDGAYKDDSEVRRHVLGTFDEEGTLDLKRSDVRTEVLSPEGAQQVYKDWADSEEAQYQKAMQQGRRAYTPDTSMKTFNRMGAEYYGQQGLKLAGFEAVPDSMRSNETKRSSRYHDNNSLGTDRLIENSGKLSDRDTGYGGDFRVIKDGELVVIDNQTATPDSNTYNMNLIKSQYGDNKMNARDIEKELGVMAQELKRQGKATDLDSIMSEMVNQGLLPSPVRGKANKSTPGMQPGKFMSAAPNIGSVNVDEQHQIQKLLFTNHDPYKMSNSFEGMQPESMALFDAQKMREQVGDYLAKYGKLPAGSNAFSHGGDDVQLALGTKTSGLLRDDMYAYNKQLSKPYGF